TLPSHADPDTSNTLSVDLSESQGQLLSGTTADADAFVTLCLCDGELIAYQTATLTAAHQYELTYLRRGVYGTPIGAHSSGTSFAMNSATSFAAGDVLTLAATATPDATLANLAWTLSGTL